MSGIVYKKEVIERAFADVVKMFRLEESETYKMIIEKGVKERNIEIAKKLLKKGISINEIAEITELSKEEIKKLIN